MPKITFIGAGSFGFTRTLVRDLLTFPYPCRFTYRVDGHQPGTSGFRKPGSTANH